VFSLALRLHIAITSAHWKLLQKWISHAFNNLVLCARCPKRLGVLRPDLGLSGEVGLVHVVRRRVRERTEIQDVQRNEKPHARRQIVQLQQRTQVICELYHFLRRSGGFHQ